MQNIEVQLLNRGGYRLMAMCAAAFALAASDAGANTAYLWRGTADNPVWDTTTANWASSSSDTTRKAWVNNTSSSSGSNPTFDTNGATDITVDADGVEGFEFDSGGTHTLSGGPVTMHVFDMNNGNLTIYNRFTCTDTGGSLGFRMYGGAGTVTVGDGGYLDAYFSPFNSANSGKLIVLKNGTFRAKFNNLNNSNKPTIYFDGGTLIHPEESDKTFVSSKLVLGAGGMHVGQADGIVYQSFVPGPILTDDTLATDGGVTIDQQSKYALLPNNDCTYRGGLHINSSSAEGVGIRRDRSLGAVPATPQDNVFFDKSGACLVAHGSNGRIALDKNRNLRIADGVLAKLQTWSGSAFSLIVQGTIDCDNRENGIVEIYSHYGVGDNGVVALCPADGRTNHIGRLCVRSAAVIGSGTTLLENSAALNGSSSGEERYGYDAGAPLYIQHSSGYLQVTGGVLKVSSNGRHVTQNGRLTVSGGVADFSTVSEMLHASLSGSTATTTVKDGGRLVVTSIRMSGAGSGADAAKSVLNLETGGVIRVTGDIYIHKSHPGYKATVNCNGGTLEWANTATSRNCPVGTDGLHSLSETLSGITWNVKEGGLVVSNDVICYFRPALVSGAASDGGVTKWGSGTFALFNTGSTFNGPVTIMQGEFRLGAAGVIPATCAARVAAGASFIPNTFAQTLSRIEGSGTFRDVLKNGSPLITVTSAIAPGMGADEVGTLTVSGGAINIADDTALEIDVKADGTCDRFSYPAGLDLSKMTLQVNDTTKLNKDRKYAIASIPQGCIGEFISTNLPDGWVVKFNASTKELFLEYPAPLVMVVR